jgi:hypothetical protein
MRIGVGVNEVFVVVTVDTSFTTEQAVVGHIDEIHILITVRTSTIVGYLSPSQICDVYTLLRVRKLDMEMTSDSLEDFLTKTARVSAPWCAPTSSLTSLFDHLMTRFPQSSVPLKIQRHGVSSQEAMTIVPF